ncbi:hypothetical protein VUR80DRAFT_154 [Thermomyces stellatus]
MRHFPLAGYRLCLFRSYTTALTCYSFSTLSQLPTSYILVHAGLCVPLTPWHRSPASHIMTSFILTILVFLLFLNPAFSLFLDLGAASNSPCGHICAAATQDGTPSCEYRDLTSANLQECLVCLHEGGQADAGNRYSLANRTFQNLPLIRMQ